MSLVHQESTEIFLHFNTVTGNTDRNLSSCDTNNGVEPIIVNDNTRLIGMSNSVTVTDSDNDQTDPKLDDICVKNKIFLSAGSDDDSSKDELAFNKAPDGKQKKCSMKLIESDSSDEDVFMKRRSLQKTFTDSDDDGSASKNVAVSESDELSFNKAPDSKQGKCSMQLIESDSSDEDVFMKRRSLQKTFTDSDDDGSAPKNVAVSESDELSFNKAPDSKQGKCSMKLIESDSSEEDIFTKRRSLQKTFTDSDDNGSAPENVAVPESDSQIRGDEFANSQHVGSKRTKKRRIIRKNSIDSDSDDKSENQETFESVSEHGTSRQNVTKKVSTGSASNSETPDKFKKLQQLRKSRKNLNRKRSSHDDGDSGANTPKTYNTSPRQTSVDPLTEPLDDQAELTPLSAESENQGWQKLLHFTQDDSESSEGEGRMYESQRKSSPEMEKSFSGQKKKTTGPRVKPPPKPKPVSKKVMEDERKQIQSEAQRRLRHQRVELPVCTVKPRTLDEFLAKRRSLPKLNTSIRMSTAEINKWIEREKQLKLIYRSESSDSEKENDSSLTSSQPSNSLDIAQSSQFNSSMDKLKESSPLFTTQTNLLKDLLVRDPEFSTCTEDVSAMDVSKANAAESDISAKKASVSKQLFGPCETNNDELCKESVQSKVTTEEGDNNVAPPVSGPTEVDVRCVEKVCLTEEAKVGNTVTGSSLGECVSSENMKGDNLLVNTNKEKDLVKPATCLEVPTEEGDTSSSKQNCTIEENLRKLRETLAEEEDSDDEFLFRLSEDSDSDSELKNKKFNEKFKTDSFDVTCNKNDDIVKETGSVSDLTEVLPDKDIKEQTSVPDTSKVDTLEYGSRRLALLRQKGLVSVDNICPRLSGGPEDIVDLDDIPRETKKDGVMSLMERFIKHSTKPKPAKKCHVDLSILSAEKGSTGLEGIKKDVVTILLGDEGTEESDHVHGSKYVRLQRGLQQQIAQERKAEWLKKSQMIVEKTDDEKSECGLLDDEEEMTVSEEEEVEEDEEEEEDVPLVDKERTKSAFMDDEAEESEAEDAEISPDEEEDEIEDGTKVKQKKEVFTNDNGDDEDVDEGDADVSASEEEEETEDCSKTHGKKKKLVKRSKRVDDDEDDDEEEIEEDKLNDKESLEDEKTSTPNNSQKKFRRLITLDLFDSDEETNPARVLDKSAGNEQDASASMSSAYMSNSMVSGEQTATPREHEPSPIPSTPLFDFLSPIVIEDHLHSPYGTPVSSKEAPSNLQKSFSKQLFFDADDIPSTQEYMEVLMGNTNANKKKQDPPAKLNITGLLGPADDLPTSQAADDELLGLMSGTFVTQGPNLVTASQCKSNAFTQAHSQPRNSQTDQGASQKEDEERGSIPSENVRKIEPREDALKDRLATLRSPQEEYSQHLSMALVSSDDEEIGLPGKTEVMPKKKTQKKLDFSDEEDVEGCEEGGEEGEEEDERDPALIEYDSEENEIVPSMARTKDFLDVEAELSESEWDSADEDERGMDRLDSEDGDDEQLDTDAMKEQLGQMHMRRVLDDDQREVRLLQEMLFEDGDLHSEGGGRERQFRWKNSDGGFAADDARNDSDGGVDEAEEEEEELWRKARHERETFLRKQREKAEATGKPVEGMLIEEDSQLIILGKKAMRRIRSVHSHQEQIVTERTKITIKSYSESILSPDPKKPFKIMAKRGSFLARSEDALARIATLAKGTSDSVVLNNNNSSRNCVFATISPKEEPQKEVLGNKSKRKLESVTPTLDKKPKLITKTSKGCRLFDHLN